MVKKREFQGEISAGKLGEKIPVKAFILISWRYPGEIM